MAEGQKPSQVRTELNKRADLIGDLANAATDLEGRLDSVITLSPETGQDTGKTIEEAKVPLALELADKNAILNNIIQGFRRLIERIEV